MFDWILNTSLGIHLGKGMISENCLEFPNHSVFPKFTDNNIYIKCDNFSKIKL